MAETQEGGLYKTPEGTLVDANGKPAKRDASARRQSMEEKGSPRTAAAEEAAEEGAAKDYERMSVEALHAEAGGLEITGTGANGKVLKADLVKALQQRDRAAEKAA